MIEININPLIGQQQYLFQGAKLSHFFQIAKGIFLSFFKIWASQVQNWATALFFGSRLDRVKNGFANQ